MSHVSWHQTYLRRFDCMQDCNNSYDGSFIFVTKAISIRSRIFLPGVVVIIKQYFISKNSSWQNQNVQLFPHFIIPF